MDIRTKLSYVETALKSLYQHADASGEYRKAALDTVVKMVEEGKAFIDKEASQLIEDLSKPIELSAVDKGQESLPAEVLAQQQKVSVTDTDTLAVESPTPAVKPAPERQTITADDVGTISL